MKLYCLTRKEASVAISIDNEKYTKRVVWRNIKHMYPELGVTIWPIYQKPAFPEVLPEEWAIFEVTMLITRKL